MSSDKGYVCPQGGCGKEFGELLEVRGHLAFDHKVWFQCNEEEWLDVKNGKSFVTSPVTTDQIKWG